jgi:hypothetical protein
MPAKSTPSTASLHPECRPDRRWCASRTRRPPGLPLTTATETETSGQSASRLGPPLQRRLDLPGLRPLQRSPPNPALHSTATALAAQPPSAPSAPSAPFSVPSCGRSYDPTPFGSSSRSSSASSGSFDGAGRIVRRRLRRPEVLLQEGRKSERPSDVDSEVADRGRIGAGKSCCSLGGLAFSTLHCCATRIPSSALSYVLARTISAASPKQLECAEDIQVTKRGD